HRPGECGELEEQILAECVPERNDQGRRAANDEKPANQLAPEDVVLLHEPGEQRGKTTPLRRTRAVRLGTIVGATHGEWTFQLSNGSDRSKDLLGRTAVAVSPLVQGTTIRPQGQAISCVRKGRTTFLLRHSRSVRVTPLSTGVLSRSERATMMVQRPCKPLWPPVARGASSRARLIIVEDL